MSGTAQDPIASTIAPASGVSGSGAINGTITSYNGTATAGGGVAVVRASGRSTAQVAAVASVAAFTVGAADGTFEVSANVLITTYASGTFTVTCAYTDESNSARTLTMNLSTVGGAIATACAAAGPFMGLVSKIRCKAATTITIATAGTFTSLTYNVGAEIVQVA